MATLKIGATQQSLVDMTPYVANGGIKWQRNDVDDPETGRALDAKMYRGRIASKIRLDITCRPLTTTEASVILSAIMPEYVWVQYTDPQTGSDVTKEMYANNNPATYLMKDEHNVDWWTGITFPLVER